MGGAGPGAPGGEGGGEPEGSGSATMRRADAMGSPPVMIHLRFTNNGSEKADVIIADFLSPLGNFAVRPDKLALDPGQSLEVDPMTSRLAGEVTGGEITLSLQARSGNGNENRDAGAEAGKHPVTDCARQVKRRSHSGSSAPNPPRSWISSDV